MGSYREQQRELIKARGAALASGASVSDGTPAATEQRYKIVPWRDGTPYGRGALLADRLALGKGYSSGLLSFAYQTSFRALAGAAEQESYVIDNNCDCYVFFAMGSGSISSAVSAPDGVVGPFSSAVVPANDVSITLVMVVPGYEFATIPNRGIVWFGADIPGLNLPSLGHNVIVERVLASRAFARPRSRTVSSRVYDLYDFTAWDAGEGPQNVPAGQTYQSARFAAEGAKNESIYVATSAAATVSLVVGTRNGGTFVVATGSGTNVILDSPSALDYGYITVQNAGAAALTITDMQAIIGYGS